MRHYPSSLIPRTVGPLFSSLSMIVLSFTYDIFMSSFEACLSGYHVRLETNPAI